ncbi:alanine racemase [soil metagenome]
MTDLSQPLRLHLDGHALVSNWRALRALGGGAACGAAIKADGYGLGAREVMARLAAAGCRDFFVATWSEALALMPLADGLTLSVFHGVRAEDMAVALSSGVRPVLNTPEQIGRWRAAGGGLCDVMVDTGMNRLGLDWRGDVAGLLQGMQVGTLMSHLASGDEDSPLNALQRDRFAALAGQGLAARHSLANSAGILLGEAYHFGLTRPGLALYGGIARPEACEIIAQTVFPQAQILQRRRVLAGDGVGYNVTFAAGEDMEVAILNLGYADGYARGFSGRGAALADGVRLPVLGRVSMDLLIIDVSARPDLHEGDWVGIDYDLTAAAAQSGLSQYELLTGLGRRYDRVWV